MQKFSTISLLVLLFISVPLSAQLDLPAVIDHDVPDFGAVSGTWGHLQYYRPFGVKGIILKEWSDLAAIHPLSGEPFNTDRQGWFPLGTRTSLWSQTHPALTATADTTAPSLLVNYKQGEAKFNDFTLWYHNSLGESIRYGWNSKLRSHSRFLGITAYDEQNHRLQVESEINEQSLRVEVGYKHQINPLYLYELDTTHQFVNYNDALQIKSKRWDGSLHWDNYDSTSSGSELFAWVEGGLWDWPVGQRQSLSALVYLGSQVQIAGWSPFRFKIGIMSKQVGGDRSTRNFMELSLPKLRLNKFSADIGLKNFGLKDWLPAIDLNYTWRPLQISYKTHTLVEDRTWDQLFNTTTVHELQSSLNFSIFSFELSHWQSSKNERLMSGNQIQSQLNLPWGMQLALGGSIIRNPVDWVWSEEQINWELNQEFMLFDDALYGHLKLWGRHLMSTLPGLLDSETLLAQPTYSIGNDEIVHLLNYTIYGQVSTLILGFTDSNILQDPLWSQYADVPWSSEYMIMANQFTNTRYRYLSLIWVFDN